MFPCQCATIQKRKVANKPVAETVGFPTSVSSRAALECLLQTKGFHGGKVLRAKRSGILPHNMHAPRPCFHFLMLALASLQTPTTRLRSAGEARASLSDFPTSPFFFHQLDPRIRHISGVSATARLAGRVVRFAASRHGLRHKCTVGCRGSAAAGQWLPGPVVPTSSG